MRLPITSVAVAGTLALAMAAVKRTNPADHSPSDGALGRQDGLPEDTLKTKLHTGEGE